MCGDLWPFMSLFGQRRSRDMRENHAPIKRRTYSSGHLLFANSSHLRLPLFETRKLESRRISSRDQSPGHISPSKFPSRKPENLSRRRSSSCPITPPRQSLSLPFEGSSLNLVALQSASRLAYTWDRSLWSDHLRLFYTQFTKALSRVASCREWKRLSQRHRFAEERVQYGSNRSGRGWTTYRFPR